MVEMNMTIVKHFMGVPMRVIKQRRGYVTLVSVLVVSAVGVVAGVSLLFLGLNASQMSFSLQQSYQAKALANLCAEDALQRIHDVVSFSGVTNITIGPGACSSTVTTGGGQNRTITASGTVGSVVRKVKITLDKITPSIHLSLWQEVADF